VDLGVPGVQGAALVGRGGFGAVYRAEQPDLGRPVAVKLLSGPGDPQALRRFRRECTAIGSLSGHPNIVAVYAAGANESGVPYLVMQLLLRGSLADLLAEAGPLPWDDVAEIGVKLAGALATAHGAGVLHRDIKPANVLMSDYGEPMLADFGIARVAGAKETTAAGAAAHTVAHAPPEAMSGQTWTERCDVWSLASTLHELLSGQPPFLRPEDESLVPLLARLAVEPPPDLRPRGVPDQLCTVLEAAMAKDPEARVHSAADLGRKLRAVQVALGRAPTPLPIAGPAVEAKPSLGYRPPPQLERPPPQLDRPPVGPPPVPPTPPPTPLVASPHHPADPPTPVPLPVPSGPGPFPGPTADQPAVTGGVAAAEDGEPERPADAGPEPAPVGTVTFLFTDIEGSTRLLDALGEAYSEVLATTRRCISTAVADNGGRVVDVRGDALLASFTRASRAVAAAADAQRALAAVRWPREPVRVRMAVHAGEASYGPEGYVSTALPRGARLGAAAHGGQVLVSELARQLAGRLPPQLELSSLGTHQLPDWPGPEPVHQLVVDGRSTTFPPLSGVVQPAVVPRLVEVDGTSVLLLVEGRHVLGRAAGADFVLPDHRKLVSRSHCMIQVRGGTIEVEDLGSQNGTYVNSTRITAPTPLRTGDRLRVGASTFAVEGVEPAAGDGKRRRWGRSGDGARQDQR
jgi:serine/threonine protein kinase/class 3 adenylate cyclase